MEISTRGRSQRDYDDRIHGNALITLLSEYDFSLASTFPRGRSLDGVLCSGHWTSLPASEPSEIQIKASLQVGIVCLASVELVYIPPV